MQFEIYLFDLKTFKMRHECIDFSLRNIPKAKVRLRLKIHTVAAGGLLSWSDDQILASASPFSQKLMRPLFLHRPLHPSHIDEWDSEDLPLKAVTQALDDQQLLSPSIFCPIWAAAGWLLRQQCCIRWMFASHVRGARLLHYTFTLLHFYLLLDTSAKD